MKVLVHSQADADAQLPRLESILDIQPSSLTILPTYKCTAQCEQCCFSSSPRLTQRLPLTSILERIDEVTNSFSMVRHATFSGGEALLLKDDLLTALRTCAAKGMTTRVVSNGFWGRRPEGALEKSSQLRSAGLTELNLSTGADHIKYVPLPSVLNAAESAIACGIRTLITVEADADDSTVLSQLFQDQRASRLLQERKLMVISNSCMSFKSGTSSRTGGVSLDLLRRGCPQIFNTITVTPSDQLASCCGLTMEHIPDLKLGRIVSGTIKSLYESQLQDALKIWLRVDGPYRIIERLMGVKAARLLDGVQHICEACAILHNNHSIIQTLRLRYEEFVPEITERLAIDVCMTTSQG